MMFWYESYMKYQWIFDDCISHLWEFLEGYSMYFIKEHKDSLDDSRSKEDVVYLVYVLMVF